MARRKTRFAGCAPEGVDGRKTDGYGNPLSRLSSYGSHEGRTVTQRQEAGLAASRGVQARGLNERLAQRHVVHSMEEQIQNHLSVRDVTDSEAQ